MAITYQGTVGATFKGDRLTVNSVGSITSVREYEMDGTEVAAFIAAWPRGTLHPTDARLYLKGAEWENKSAGPVTVNLKFEGAEDTEATYDTGNNARLVKTEMIERVANITKGGVEYALTYDCPTAYVEWYKRATQTTAVKKAVSNIEEFTTIQFKACAPAEGVANPNTFFTLSTDYELEPFGSIETEPSGDVYKIIEIWQMVVINVT